MKKSNRLFRIIFTAAILAVLIALMSFTALAAQPFEGRLHHAAGMILMSRPTGRRPEGGGASFALHLLDVGQGQCVLIEADGRYMLIDGGGRSSSSFVVSYLKQLGIEHFDYIALSHYDEDHMSGLVGVLSVFPCEQILLPTYAGEGELYQSFATAAVSNGAVIQHPRAGETFFLGNATVEVIGPVRTDYEGENDRSLVLRISYGDVSCLVSGDAEQESEWDMAGSGMDISADVYVAGHHGSRTSTTEPFLDAVAPAYALISCGQGNSYGHPTVEVLQRLQERGIEMYRTDVQGTVILYSDGSSIWFEQEPCQEWTPGSYDGQTRLVSVEDGSSGNDVTSSDDSSGEFQYVCNTNTKKFHYPSCDSVKQMNESNRMNTNLSRDELMAQGYQPCGNCRP